MHRPKLTPRFTTTATGLALCVALFTSGAVVAQQPVPEKEKRPLTFQWRAMEFTQSIDPATGQTKGSMSFGGLVTPRDGDRVLGVCQQIRITKLLDENGAEIAVTNVPAQDDPEYEKIRVQTDQSQPNYRGFHNHAVHTHAVGVGRGRAQVARIPAKVQLLAGEVDVLWAEEFKKIDIDLTKLGGDWIALAPDMRLKLMSTNFNSNSDWLTFDFESNQGGQIMFRGRMSGTKTDPFIGGCWLTDEKGVRLADISLNGGGGVRNGVRGGTLKGMPMYYGERNPRFLRLIVVSQSRVLPIPFEIKDKEVPALRVIGNTVVPQANPVPDAKQPAEAKPAVEPAPQPAVAPKFVPVRPDDPASKSVKIDCGELHIALMTNIAFPEDKHKGEVTLKVKAEVQNEPRLLAVAGPWRTRIFDDQGQDIPGIEPPEKKEPKDYELRVPLDPVHGGMRVSNYPVASTLWLGPLDKLPTKFNLQARMFTIWTDETQTVDLDMIKPSDQWTTIGPNLRIKLGKLKLTRRQVHAELEVDSPELALPIVTGWIKRDMPAPFIERIAWVDDLDEEIPAGMMMSLPPPATEKPANARTISIQTMLRDSANIKTMRLKIAKQVRYVPIDYEIRGLSLGAAPGGVAPAGNAPPRAK